MMGIMYELFRNEVWIADYNGNDSVWNEQPVANQYWSYDQRYSQYNGSHFETYGGVTLNIDNDCANGPVSSLFPITSDADSSGLDGGANDPLEDPACK